MIVNTNKERGNAGLSFAVAYYGCNGYTVSLPLNDTQDYDLIIDDGNKLYKVQAKFSKQRSEYGVQRVSLRSLGGTKGSVYKRLVETDVDLVFCVNPEMEMWSIPKSAINQTNSISLGTAYDQYRVYL